MAATQKSPGQKRGQTLRAARRIVYFIDHLYRLKRPQRWSANRTNRLLQRFDDLPLDHPSRARLDFYCKLDGPFETPPSPIKHVEAKRSRYYLDFMRHAKGFSPEARVRYAFGDITVTPDTPTFVKSRPSAGANENAVLLPLDRLRHFEAFSDPLPFEEKRPGAVWRGVLHNDTRRLLVDRFASSELHDIAAVGRAAGKAAFLPPQAQLAHQVILSVEGVDVATNLKWAMGSNSLTMSPALRFETWYMESRLKPGVHFAEVKPDFSDLDDATAYYARHPDKAHKIIAAANAWRAMFDDTETEDMVAAAVIRKFLQLSSG